VECTICHEPILNYAVVGSIYLSAPSPHKFLVEQSPVSTALCPSSNCRAVSHLKCLSQDFIDLEDQPTIMIPRGGDCKSCKQYILWGDIIRGCYRRMPPSEAAIPLMDIDTDGMFVSDNLEVHGRRKSSLRRKRSTSRRRKPLKEKKKQISYSSSTSASHENEILSNFVTSSESEDIPGPVKRKSGRPRKSQAVPTIRRLSPKANAKQKHSTDSVFTNEGEIFDLVASSESEDNATPMKRKPGRPRRNSATLSLGTSSLVSSPQPLKVSRKSKKSASLAKPKPLSKGKGKRSSDSLSTSEGENFELSLGTSSLVSSPQPLKVSRKSKKSASLTKPKLSSKGKGKRSSDSLSTSEGEIFDFDNLASSSASEAACTPVKRKRRQSRKDISLLSPAHRDISG
jgi:hypothetical protein